MHGWLLFIPVGIVWFVLYWIIGGIIFSIAALFRVAKLRKAQFSCLFTLASLGCAYGATYTGFLFGQKEINVCLSQARDIFEQLASVFACGILPMVFMGSAWFLGLLLLGSILLFISRAKNQSWVDEKLDESCPEPIGQIKEFHVH